MMDPLWSETCWSNFKYFIIIIIIINIKDWTLWSVPSPELQLFAPTLLRSSNCSPFLYNNSNCIYELYICASVGLKIFFSIYTCLVLSNTDCEGAITQIRRYCRRASTNVCGGRRVTSTGREYCTCFCSKVTETGDRDGNYWRNNL